MPEYARKNGSCIFAGLTIASSSSACLFLQMEEMALSDLRR
jgi:hypothetical protein